MFKGGNNMKHELTFNELIMLDALAYFSQLSDGYEITDDVYQLYHNIGEFVDDAIVKEYKTCFNDLKSDEKNGMVEILNLVKQNPRLTRLEMSL